MTQHRSSSPLHCPRIANSVSTGQYSMRFKDGLPIVVREEFVE
ncbi:MAG: hypothetical protein ACFFD1_07705 [Candidatus Thorarchaeota archaeon]